MARTTARTTDDEGERPTATRIGRPRRGGLRACRRFRELACSMEPDVEDDIEEQWLDTWIKAITEPAEELEELQRALVGLAHADARRAGLALERFEAPRELAGRLQPLMEVARLEWKRRHGNSLER